MIATYVDTQSAIKNIQKIYYNIFNNIYSIIKYQESKNSHKTYITIITQ